MADTLPIALVGFGRMGHILYEMAGDYGCEVVAIVDPHHNDGQSAITRQTVDAAAVGIDFSLPEAVPGNIRAACDIGLPMVVGTTGWNEHLADIRRMVKRAGIGLVHGSNFSVGMNAFFAIVESAAALMNNLSAYDPFLLEMHHRGKADSPSGTAHTLAQIVLGQVERKQQLQTDRVQRRIEPDELHVGSLRAGSIPGTHLVGFDSPADTIELRHTARDRSGFAAGALLAARWIAGRHGTYNFRDIFYEVIGA